MAIRNRICSHCGCQFCYEIKRGSDRIYCSEDCAKKASKIKLLDKAKHFKQCSVDGCLEKAVRVGAGLCEKHYMRLRRNGKTDALVDVSKHDKCKYCGKPIEPGKFCSKRCAARYARGNSRFKNCVVCGKEFEPLNKGIDRITCSDECLREHKRVISRSFYALQISTNPLFVERVRLNEYKRRARKKNAFVENVSRSFVMERDKWTCHLCGEKIPKQAQWPNALFGTLDHVIPLAAGGKHSYANVKAAHLKCNCSKNDKIVGQLGLEFAA